MLLEIAPNPFSRTCVVSVNKALSSSCTFTLVDAHGRIRSTWKGNGGSRFELNRAELSAGLYLLRLEENGRAIGTVRLVAK
ncbi:MAG: T9SS type A sorting domain-containing protein [Flavobacteriales bacterium]|nr:T9SS type A sorting domain-containing protein [Flavobacteriales bacterium]